jgi:acyl-homoserine-lactone acylase
VTQAAHRLLRAGLCAAACVVAGCGGSNGGGGFFGGPAGPVPPGPPAPADKYSAEVRWTQYGLPHIKAKDYAGLGYGQGYAVARDQLCLLADRVVTLRGERSERFGPEGVAVVAFMQIPNLDSDLFYRVQLSDDEVESAWKGLSADARQLAEGYAAGFNRLLRDMAPEARAAACKGVEPPQMKASDVLRATMQVGSLWKALGVAPYASASTWDQLGAPPVAKAAADRPPAQQMASNAWAYGAEATGTNASIMVANPHTLWQDHWLLMHQMHLTIPGEIDVMGADFLGLPLPLSGFTQHLAWSIEAPSTVTYPLLIAMDVKSGAKPSYTVDGASHALEMKTVELRVKQADGSVRTQSYSLPYSHLGPLYRLPAATGRLAGWHAVTDPNVGNARALDQILAVAKARDIGGFEKAVAQNRGITAHLIAGDSQGQAMYIESGPLLDIGDAALRDCAVVPPPDDATVPGALDGRRSACAVRGADGQPRLAAAGRIPALATRGIVQNANDSYSLSLVGQQLDGYSLLLGSAKTPPGARTLMSQRQIEDSLADGRIDTAEATDMVFGNRNYLAETTLDAVLAACTSAAGDAAVQRACGILAAWDRRHNVDSRGALLFTELGARLASVPGLYAEPYDPARPFRVRPVSTAAGVTAGIVAAVRDTAGALDALGLRGDERWGDMLARPTPNGRVPLHGGPGGQGVLNALEGAPLTKDGYGDIIAGTSYVHVVTWVQDKLVARVMVASGQSTDPASPHHDDQLALFSRKQLVTPPFTDAEIAADPKLEQLTLRE